MGHRRGQVLRLGDHLDVLLLREQLPQTTAHQGVTVGQHNPDWSARITDRFILAKPWRQV